LPCADGVEPVEPDLGVNEFRTTGVRRRDRCVVTRSQPLTGLQGVGVGEHLMQSILQESAFAGGIDQGQRFAISGRGFLPTAGAAE
jgi:hypothetical protein